METVNTTVHKLESVEKALEVKKEVRPGANGSQYVHLESANFSISLFPAKEVASDADKKSILKYNARIVDRRNGYAFSFPIRQLGDGTLIAGQKSKLTGFRSVVYDYIKAENKSYDKLSIPGEAYNEIIAMVAVADSAE